MNIEDIEPIDDDSEGAAVPPENLPKELATKKNPFKSGYAPTGIRRQKQLWYTKRSLLKTMLEVPIMSRDLPTALADRIRLIIPGFLDNVERKFTMYQIMELVQLQLLFSPSDYVKQDAINAIKDRVEGKPMQKIQVENMEAEPTQFVMPNGRTITI
jgi:hypothetical protein